jgi:DNA-directed RNA polymerase subunit RPC12/RpoP
MPYQEYECHQCGKRLTLEFSSQERSKRFDFCCPRCHDRHLQRRLPPANVKPLPKT